jgi:hypothetical protein
MARLIAEWAFGGVWFGIAILCIFLTAPQIAILIILKAKFVSRDDVPEILFQNQLLK